MIQTRPLACAASAWLMAVAVSFLSASPAAAQPAPPPGGAAGRAEASRPGNDAQAQGQDQSQSSAQSQAQDGGTAADGSRNQGQNASGENQQQGGQGEAADIERAASLWEDFVHYIRIAQLQLASSSGQALMQAGLSSEQWLRIVENSPYAEDYGQTLRRAMRMEGDVSPVARRVAERIEQARIDLARAGDRIRNAIGKLDDGLRPRTNAQQRLRAAGQYAAPHLLDVLLSGSQEAEGLRPYVIDVMVYVGRSLVSPLSQALSGLPPVPKQQVAEVLGRIGYPIALPYLKAELERDDLASETREAIRTAYDQIVANARVSQSASAATLFLQLGEDYYAHKSILIPEPDAQTNLMWHFEPNVGLSYTQVPTPIYFEAQTMRASRRSLQLNSNLTASLSLWLASNFRRENNLTQGMQDPTYGQRMRSPHFYATLAGPRHLQPVLQRAIEDNDAALALDAIRALASTSSARSLLTSGSGSQPLIAAMNYPDQRVRFESAFAIARAQPGESFSGARRVVPVLTEALRVGGSRSAVVIAPNQQMLNQTTQMVRAAGEYNLIIGDSIEAVRDPISDAPGVGLLVLNVPISQARNLLGAADSNPKLRNVPAIVVAQGDQQAEANRAFRGNQNVTVVNAAADPRQRAGKMQQAAASTGSGSLSDDQATGYALNALDILQTLAVRSAGPFDATEATPALIAALDDGRNEVVLRSARILSEFEAREAQRAIAEAALASQRGQEMRIRLLNDLARSARQHGNKLRDRQLDDLIALVNNTQGSLANAASEAYGALNLPTSHAVEFITSGAGSQQQER